MKSTELRQKAAEKIKAAGAILAAVGENDVSEDDTKAFDVLHDEAAALNKQADIVDKQAAAEAKSLAHRPAVMENAPVVLRHPLGEIKSLSQWLGLLITDPVALAATQEVKTADRGGYLVPEIWRSDLLSLPLPGIVMRPRATVFPASRETPDALVHIPAMVQGTEGAFSGVTVTWIGEGDVKPQTDMKLREVQLQPNEVAAHMILTDKLLRNSNAGAIAEKLLRAAMQAAEDYAFLRGDGSGKPLGVLHSSNAGLKEVTRTTASHVEYADIVNMYAAMSPESRGRAFWVASPTVWAEIVNMSNDVGTIIYGNGNIADGVPATLLGLPIEFTGRVPVLGTTGDIALIDGSAYLIQDGSGPSVESSQHVYFTSNKTVIKAYWFVDGQPWVNVPLTLEDGSTTVSPYVVLSD